MQFACSLHYNPMQPAYDRMQLNTIQGRIQKYGLWGREGVGSRPLSSPSSSRPVPFPSPPVPFPSPPFSLEVGPLNPARGTGGAL